MTGVTPDSGYTISTPGQVFGRRSRFLTWVASPRFQTAEPEISLIIHVNPGHVTELGVGVFASRCHRPSSLGECDLGDAPITRALGSRALSPWFSYPHVLLLTVYWTQSAPLHAQVVDRAAAYIHSLLWWWSPSVLCGWPSRFCGTGGIYDCQGAARARATCLTTRSLSACVLSVENSLCMWRGSKPVVVCDVVYGVLFVWFVCTVGQYVCVSLVVGLSVCQSRRSSVCPCLSSLSAASHALEAVSAPLRGCKM